MKFPSDFLKVCIKLSVPIERFLLCFDNPSELWLLTKVISCGVTQCYSYFSFCRWKPTFRDKLRGKAKILPETTSNDKVVVYLAIFFPQVWIPTAHKAALGLFPHLFCIENTYLLSIGEISTDAFKYNQKSTVICFISLKLWLYSSEMCIRTDHPPTLFPA